MTGYPESFLNWWNSVSPDLERFEELEGVNISVGPGRYNNVIFSMKVPQQLVLTATEELQEWPARVIKRDIAIPVLQSLSGRRCIELLREKYR